MGQIIPFDKATQGDLAALQEVFAPDTSLVVSGGFPVLSIKGGKFAVVRNGEREVIRNPQTGDVATSVEVVIVAYNPNVSKVFYVDKYEEGSNDKPTCYSNDGISPASDAQEPQSMKCATCPHNAWGSRVTDSGKQAKACSDSRRLAVAAPTQLNEPMLLRVPPTSMRPLGDYQKKLANRKLALQAVVTKLSFDPDSSSPLLQFTPVGLCSLDMVHEIKAMQDDSIVKQIIGTEEVAFVDENGVDPEAEEPAEPVAAAPKKTAKKKVAKKAAAKKAEPPAESKPAEEPAAPAATENDDHMFAALDAMLDV